LLETEILFIYLKIKPLDTLKKKENKVLFLFLLILTKDPLHNFYLFNHARDLQNDDNGGVIC
jgi:hypothetical protein